MVAMAAVALAFEMLKLAPALKMLCLAMSKMLPFALAEHLSRTSWFTTTCHGPLRTISKACVHLEPPLRHEGQFLRLRHQDLGICFKARGGDP